MANVASLAKAIKDQLKLLPTEVQQIIDAEGNAFAGEAVKDLKKISPIGQGKYAGSWARMKDVSSAAKGTVYRVYNKKHYQLTHLLEYGHIIHGTGERTRAFPHISTVDQKIRDEYPKRVEEAINNAHR